MFKVFRENLTFIVLIDAVRTAQ